MGIKATWWMGIIIGIILIPVGLIIPGWKNYFFIMLQTFICVCITSSIIGIIAMIYGLLKFDINYLPGFIIPHGVENRINFCVVGNMHNFSYIGGIAGIITGLVFLIKRKIKIK